MNTIHRKEPVLLFFGDVVVLIVSLILTLLVRYGAFPLSDIFDVYAVPFSILFVLFLLVNFIAGLYEQHTLIFKNRLPITLLNVQLVNAGLGIAFFYFLPFFTIAPKTILFIYLVLSLLLMSVWRMFLAPKMGPKKTQKALLLGDSGEVEELRQEINHNSRYNISFVDTIPLVQDTAKMLSEIKNSIHIKGVQVVIVDTRHPLLIDLIPQLYPLAISGIQFFEMGKMYESIFERIPVSLVSQTWFIENMSSMSPQIFYDGIKRTIDIVVSFLWALVSLVLYPFIIIAMKIENERGVIFTYQPRIGQRNKTVNIIKFRTMTIANDNGEQGSVKNEVTKVGLFLRKSRLDELPQLWNIFVGDLSLVGPRPELPKYVDQYSKEIPNYNIRHSVKPGLFGWAQIYHEKHPHHGIDTTETANKLSYDLYYVKHRSLLLDIKIILRSVKVLLTFTGR